ncbi:M23 family metallopeptidase [Cochleicola gelatinilyticus]|uniref:Peptidase M23 n=1 Tax=Cochleicola gelatinilyticus TaxID=1763537 RepID=A0A167J1G5_9FLAO|nr:M23 family metallopeptidase [Cochleicola gelatinilyticus]OAB80232.1 peptidase M23 [Cochleicola gelatinilyticus]
MAKTKEKRRKKIKKKLLHKYRLVVLNEDTFEERFSFKLNRLNVFVFSTIFALFLIVITTLLIAFSPLREYIPGYSSTALKKKATDLTYKTDSLQQIINVNEQYLASIRKVLTGDVKTVNFNKDSILEAAQLEASQVNLLPSRQDSLLREKVSREDKYNPLTEGNGAVNLVLFAPVKGTISEGYDPKNKHFAVDVVTVKNAPVKAASDGTVIFAGWTADTGNVIILEHANNILTVYKHNASVSKEQGEVVKGGEVIASVGNSGEFTTGPHLHFEIWRDGYPVDPTNFIDFD